MGVNTATDMKLNEQHDGWWRALPFKYEAVRVYQDRRPQGFRFSPFIINIEATLSGKAILVCGEADSLELATAKAISELIERSSLLSFSKQNREVETSNGWAAHPERTSADLAAMLELVERDSVLKHWYSSTPFYQIDSDSFPSKLKGWMTEEISHSEFPQITLLISGLGLGPSVTCLLTNQAGYGVSGHSTKTELASAVESAIAEACRSAHHSVRKFFLSDTLNLRNGISGTRVNPGAHGVYYAHQEPFPQWMFGEVVSWETSLKLWADHFLQLSSLIPTFQLIHTLKNPIFVTYAKHHNCLPLWWGPTNSEALLSTLKSTMPLRKLLQGREINMKPHIVA